MLALYRVRNDVGGVDSETNLDLHRPWSTSSRQDLQVTEHSDCYVYRLLPPRSRQDVAISILNHLLFHPPRRGCPPFRRDRKPKEDLYLKFMGVDPAGSTGSPLLAPPTVAGIKLTSVVLYQNDEPRWSFTKHSQRHSQC